MWAHAMDLAYVDPFASVITDESIQRIPAEIARKTKAIGLYIVDNVLTVATATPEDGELLKRLSQITQMPISPVSIEKSSRPVSSAQTRCSQL